MCMRTRFRIALISILITAGSAELGIRAQTAQVPAASPGGVNASRLPDADGVHLGMTVDQATAVMKSHFTGNNLQIFYSHYAKGPTWVSSLQGTSTDQSDELDVMFSMPPRPQQVVYIERGLVLPPGKQPTEENTVASLRQKYGKELASTRGSSRVMTWAYDEQGQPANPQGPSNWSPADCADQNFGLVGGETPPGPGLEVDYVLGPVPLAQQLPGLTANLCNQDVFVTARLLPGAPIQGTPVITQVYIHLGEKPLMLRNAVAGQQYLDGVATTKKQQERKNAEQIKEPTL